MLISIPPQLSVSRAIYRDMWEAESALDLDLADPAEALAQIVLSMPLSCAAPASHVTPTPTTGP